MEPKNHKKKMVAPVLIAIAFLAYLVVYVLLVGKDSGWNPMMLILAIPLAGLAIGMVYVVISRIKEIRSGEEDDLSKY